MFLDITKLHLPIKADDAIKLNLDSLFWKYSILPKIQSWTNLKFETIYVCVKLDLKSTSLSWVRYVGCKPQVLATKKEIKEFENLFKSNLLKEQSIEQKRLLKNDKQRLAYQKRKPIIYDI